MFPRASKACQAAIQAVTVDFARVAFGARQAACGWRAALGRRDLRACQDAKGRVTDHAAFRSDAFRRSVDHMFE